MDADQAQTYLTTAGDKCPYCGSKAILKTPRAAGGPKGRCLAYDCNKQWVDTLTGVDEHKKGGE